MKSDTLSFQFSRKCLGDCRCCEETVTENARQELTESDCTVLIWETRSCSHYKT